MRRDNAPVADEMSKKTAAAGVAPKVRAKRAGVPRDGGNEPKKGGDRRGFAPWLHSTQVKIAPQGAL